jgi:cytosine/adenosine deaminase-related metal-dependent hydrolase
LMTSRKIFARRAVLPDATILSPACLTIAAGRIVAVTTERPPSPLDAGDIDFGDALIFPGFVNAHCHLELTALGTLPRAPFVSWVRELIRAKSDLSAQDLAAGIRDGAEKLFRSGATTIIDHVSQVTPLLCYKDLPARLILIGEVIGVARERAQAAYEAFMAARETTTVPLFASPHAPYSVHPEVIADLVAQQSPLSIHVAESVAEDAWFRLGTGPFAAFLSAFDAGVKRPQTSPLVTCFGTRQPSDTLLVHGNYFTEMDFEILAQARNSCVVHCPGSHAFFGHAAFPYEALRRYGVPVALGTDSLASNGALDMMREIRLFLTDHPLVTLAELLPMLATNAATVVGLNDVGRIQVDSSADLLVFRDARDEDPLQILSRRISPDVVLGAEGHRVQTIASLSVSMAEL